MRTLVLLLVTVLTACSKGDDASLPDIPAAANLPFADGFETDTDNFDELFPEDDNRWTARQLVDPGGGTNALALDTRTVAEGEQSLRVYAAASDAILSKAAIEKGGFRAEAGTTVELSARFFIAAAGELEDLLLLDLECCSCWDPSVADNQCPGIRLMMKAGGYLAIERGKILGTTLEQTAVAFPRGKWVEVVWTSTLSSTDEGMNRLSIDGREVITERGMNLPNADLFAAEFAAAGIDFELQEPVAYERFQIGATANPTDADVELYVDDVRLEVLE